MSELRPEPARASDFAAVHALVQAACLPTAGLGDAFPSGYAVIRRGAEIVASAGLEVYGNAGLLRSVAVAPFERGAGLARLLVEDALKRARARELLVVYLLTTTAAEYFSRFGFQPASRADVPAELRASPEFASVCPASAVCLAYPLS